MPHCYCCSYCALLNCESFTHVDIICLFVCNSCMVPTFSFEWNEEVLDHLSKDSDAFNPPFDSGFFLYVVVFLDFFFFFTRPNVPLLQRLPDNWPSIQASARGENGSVAVARTQITRVQKPQRDKTKDDHHHRQSGLALAMTINRADL